MFLIAKSRKKTTDPCQWLVATALVAVHMCMCVCLFFFLGGGGVLAAFVTVRGLHTLIAVLTTQPTFIASSCGPQGQAVPDES